jgi:hypothetical protein
MSQVSGTWNETKKLKSGSRRTYEEIHFAEYLYYKLQNFLTFSFLTMGRDVNSNITLRFYFFMWVWDFVCRSEGSTEIEGV